MFANLCSFKLQDSAKCEKALERRQTGTVVRYLLKYEALTF